MRNKVLLAVALVALATSVGAQQSGAGGKARAVGKARAERIERGRYLVTIAACHDCHSPKVEMMAPDPARPLSGRPATTQPPMQGTAEIRASLDLTAWSGPWGNSYAANLTPDPETGIGARYDEAAFIKTIRTGKKPEGEALAPPMPWNVYSQMTDEDLKAIFAYLRTVKPVKNFVRAATAAAAAQH
jgi:mono/diheme cytochrome c family protein